MPLKKGSSNRTVSKNVEELVHSYEHKGKIGNSRPASKKKAVKQAVAISLKKAGKSKYQTNSKKSKPATRKSKARSTHTAARSASRRTSGRSATSRRS